jgi:hypothetical protein
MPATILLPEGANHIEVTYSERLTREELESSVHRGIAAAQSSGRRRFLTDCRQLVGGHSVTDLYLLANEIKANGLADEFREALLLPDNPETAGLVTFWETACGNRGLVVRVFTDRAHALDWLQSVP